MSRRRAPQRLTWRGALLGVLRVIGATLGWFLFTGLFTVALMLAGVRR